MAEARRLLSNASVSIYSECYAPNEAGVMETLWLWPDVDDDISQAISIVRDSKNLTFSRVELIVA